MHGLRCLLARRPRLVLPGRPGQLSRLPGPRHLPLGESGASDAGACLVARNPGLPTLVVDNNSRDVPGMSETELHGNTDGYVLCPLRGEVPVRCCAGCPNLLRLDDRGERAVVLCTAELVPVQAWPDAPYGPD